MHSHGLDEVFPEPNKIFGIFPELVVREEAVAVSTKRDAFDPVPIKREEDIADKG